MDLATLIGFVGALAIVGAAIALGGAPGAFINAPSLLIVIMGTVLVTLMKFSLKQFMGAATIAVKAFMYKVASPQDLIQQAVELSGEARKNGLLALEDAEVKDDFFRKGIEMLVDGHDPDVVRETLNKSLSLSLERHKEGQAIFKAIGDVAPAMGMIGTLIGLVQMLSVMDDPKQIGPAMAVALLTTLYGAMIANMMALPIAHKLEGRSGEVRKARSLVIDAILSIQAGQNPRVMHEILKNYLPRSARESEQAEAA
ncbi:MAG: flagellar motor protein PomA [Gammaproteobacteria bacterium]